MIFLRDTIGRRVKEDDVDEDAVRRVGALEHTHDDVAEELTVARIVATVAEMKDLGTLHVQTPALPDGRRGGGVGGRVECVGGVRACGQGGKVRKGGVRRVRGKGKGWDGGKGKGRRWRE